MTGITAGGPDRTDEHAGGWLHQLPLAAAVLAPDGLVLSWNRGAASLMGWRGSAVPRLGAPGAAWLARLDAAVTADGSGRVMISRPGRSGRRRVELRATRNGDRDLLVLLRDCTRQTERRLERESELGRLRQFVDQLSDMVDDHAIVMTDDSGRITSWNEGAEQMTGFAAADAQGSQLDAILVDFAAELSGLLRQALEEGRADTELRLQRRDGSVIPAHVTTALLNDRVTSRPTFAVVVHDLSERQRTEENLRRSEEQLRHSQKMDAVGRLASGIAHDFNNVLTAIQGHVQFLLEDLPADLASRDDAEEIRKAADRATELTRQLLTFARKQPSRPVPLSPNSLITEIEKLLRRLIRADVTLDTVLPDVPDVLADPGQLEQVIVNLVVNARDAIGREGAITIATSSMDLSEIYSARGLRLTPGQYVMISVSDTGDGMSQETQASIFEPFFTTKPEGTGLGLSTVYGIVKQSGGHISVYSEPGRGTTFKVFLPVHGSAPSRQESPEPQTQGRAGTVLLVEDDDAVRAMAKRTLESKGYSVMEACDGEQALRMANGRKAVDVVVTDLTMPRLDGEELAARIRETRPDAGIVLMSGFAEAALVREGRIRERGHFLEKPFTPSALVDVVREAMPRYSDPSSTKST